MLGNTAFIKRRVPKKFTSIISCAMFIGIHSNAQSTLMPALLTERKKMKSAMSQVVNQALLSFCFSEKAPLPPHHPSPTDTFSTETSAG